jgi:anti-sigma factor RsiW
MTGPACRDIRQALGVYVVGAIDPAERSAVDDHLSTCPDCREELAGLAGLPSLLGRVPASEAEQLILRSAELEDPQAPPAELLSSLLRRVTARRTTRRWHVVAAAAAAVIIAVAGGAVGARVLFPGGNAASQSPVRPAADVVSRTNPQTGVSAVVKYSGRSWGTQMNVWVAGIPAGTACQFWVVDTSGHEWPAGSWTVSAGHASADYPASVSLPAAHVRAFEIISDQHVLVTVPAT